VDRKYIDNAIDELSENVYEEVLWNLAVQKWESINANDDPASRKAKLLRYLASRGFEEELIWEIIKKFENNYSF
jgi:regulatory protein